MKLQLCKLWCCSSVDLDSDSTIDCQAAAASLAVAPSEGYCVHSVITPSRPVLVLVYIIDYTTNSIEHLLLTSNDVNALARIGQKLSSNFLQS